MASVTPPSISGVNITKAYAFIQLASIFNDDSARNRVASTTQYIQVDSGSAGWTDAIELLAGFFSTDADASGFTSEIQGHADISARVSMGSATDFRWESADAYRGTFDLYIVTGLYILVS